MPKNCIYCEYNKRCPIQRAKDENNCKSKYYINSIYKGYNYLLEELRKNHE
jgi:hypothetical protein